MAAITLVVAPVRAQDDLAAARKVAAANNAVGVALYREFAAAGPGNLVFSPFSLSNALALTATGARSQTENELRQALHLEFPREQVAAGYAAMAAQLKRAARDDLVSLAVANSLWPQRDHAVTAEFLELAQEQFGADVLPLDYANPAAAAEKINGWISTKTAGLISDVVSPATFLPETRLTLCSALHFKAAWAQEFNEGKTKPAKFTLLDRKRIEVPTMRQTGWFYIAKANGCRLLRLPYAADFELVIVLPRRAYGLVELERTLSAATLRDWLIEIDSARTAYLALELPEFRIVTAPDCTAALHRFGVRAAFDPSTAGFSGISTEPGLAIGDVFQTAVIDVNEARNRSNGSGLRCPCLSRHRRAEAADAETLQGRPLIPVPPSRDTHRVILFMGRIVESRAG